MARLVTSGFESGVAPTATSNPIEGSSYVLGGGGPTIDTSPVHGLSTRSMKSVASGDQAQWSWTGATGADFFIRTYLYIDAASLANDTTFLEIMSGGTSLARVAVSSALVVKAKDGTGADLGSGPTITTGQWYRIEARINISASAGADDTFEVRVDGTSFFNSSAVTLGTVAPNRMRIGIRFLNGADTMTNHIDDVAVNDTSGTDQNSWPGAGTVVYLTPASDSSRTGFTGGGGGTTNLFAAVDNTPPVGVASTGTNTSQIGSTGNNTTDNYQANLTTYSAAGVTSVDTVKLLELRTVGGNSSTTARTAGIQLVSNPAITEATQGLGTTAAGTYPTGWTAFGTAVVYSPSVTLGTAPVAEFRKGTASTDNMMCCYIGLVAEVQQGVGKGLPFAPTAARRHLIVR